MSYPQWSTNKDYQKTDKVSWRGGTYECRNPHRSMESWAPDLALSLWLPLSAPSPSPSPIPSPPNPSPSPSPAPSTIPPVSEPFVIGIPSDKLYGKVNVGDTLTIEAADISVNNPSSFTVTGKTVKCIAKGSTCVRIQLSNGTVRLYGLYTDSGVPDNRILLGSVSEHDPINGMKWWSEFSTKDLSNKTALLTNKRSDLYYIYLNGGPADYGWRQNYTSKEYNTEPEGRRAINFMRNTQRLGGHSCFVYYNIPAGGESFFTNKENYESADYLKSYFYDLNYLLTLVNLVCPDQKVYIILEPDMMSYILQNETQSSDGKVHPDSVFFNMSKVAELKLPELANLTLESTLTGWVSAVNTLIHLKTPQVKYMHQVNLWGVLSGSNWEHGLERGLIPATTIIGFDLGKQLIIKNAAKVVEFYLEAKVDLHTDAICFDRYGLDGALVESSAATSPQTSRWFWNADIYNNFLLYVQLVATGVRCYSHLWQLPCGYINTSTEISPYTNKVFPLLSNKSPSGEDGAINFFMGGKFTNTNSYFAQNDWSDPLVKSTGSSITWESHMDAAYKVGVRSVMFGAGVGASTTNLYMGQTAGLATDNKFDIVKFQKYLFKV